MSYRSNSHSARSLSTEGVERMLVFCVLHEEALGFELRDESGGVPGGLFQGDAVVAANPGSNGGKILLAGKPFPNGGSDAIRAEYDTAVKVEKNDSVLLQRGPHVGRGDDGVLAAVHRQARIGRGAGLGFAVGQQSLDAMKHLWKRILCLVLETGMN